MENAILNNKMEFPISKVNISKNLRRRDGGNCKA